MNTRLGPAWKQRLGLRSVLELQRAYFGQAGNVNAEDLANIGARLPGYKKAEGLRVFFTARNGEIAFEYPPFAQKTAGIATEGTTEVYTLGEIENPEIESLAIMMKDGINTYHQRVAQYA